MQCPRCGSKTTVIDSRKRTDITPATTKRRRLCLNNQCKIRFSTYEKVISRIGDLNRKV